MYMYNTYNYRYSCDLLVYTYVYNVHLLTLDPLLSLFCWTAGICPELFVGGTNAELSLLPLSDVPSCTKPIMHNYIAMYCT